MPGMKMYVGIWFGLVVATVAEVVTRSLPGAALVAGTDHTLNIFRESHNHSNVLSASAL